MKKLFVILFLILTSLKVQAIEALSHNALEKLLVDVNAKIIRVPEEGDWAAGYYSVLFEDPDGIRIEANYIPGKGNLDPKVKLPIVR